MRSSRSTFLGVRAPEGNLILTVELSRDLSCVLVGTNVEVLNLLTCFYLMKFQLLSVILMTTA